MSTLAAALERLHQRTVPTQVTPFTVTFTAPCPACGTAAAWASWTEPGSKTTDTGPTGPCNHEEGQ